MPPHHFPPSLRTISRSFATAAERRATAKQEGTIASVFASLSGEPIGNNLPERFAQLKASIVTSDEHVHNLKSTWTSVLDALKTQVAEIADKSSKIVPTIDFGKSTSSTSSICEWASPEQINEIRKRGVVRVQNVVPEEVALEWKERIREYVKANPSVRGFPEDDKQVFELYWSQSQIEARGNKNFLAVSRALLQLFHAPYQNQQATSHDIGVSLNNPLSYADRLRIRHPGDSKFALGPHIDGGGVERWEDPSFRGAFADILNGKNWRSYDPFSMGKNGERLLAKTDMYQAPGACSVYRPLQGWLSMSHTGPSEGTLRVMPLLKEQTAYILLRPFFQPVHEEILASPSAEYSDAFLNATNWKFDANNTSFPGCTLGRTIELNNVTHPHLQLNKTMVPAPRVKPGDAVFWHGDLIHAVEAQHQGKSDSSVLYIPAIPLTKHNLDYVLKQKADFVHGRPPADFPGSELGEKEFQGKATAQNIPDLAAERAMGFKTFDLNTATSAAEQQFLRECNARL